MDKTLEIDASIMYAEIKDLKEPKVVLEKLSTLKPSMDWSRYQPADPVGLRFMAYGVWLEKNGKEGWADYLKESVKVLQVLSLGHMPSGIPDAPEGWIPPRDYLTKGVSKT